MLRAGVVFVVILAPLVACDNSADRAGDSAVDLPLVASTEEVYTVGAFAGEDWENFGDIARIVFDGGGNLYIVDGGGRRVVVVGPDGGHLRTIGAQGDGPGEFSSPMTAAILGDGRLVVFDFSLPGAFEIFDAEGRFLRSVPVDLAAGAPGSVMLPLADGRLVSHSGMRFRVGPAPDAEADPEEDHRRPIDVFSVDGADKESLYRAWNLPPVESGDELSGRDEQGRTALEFRFNRMRAFEPRLHVGVLSDGRVAVADSTGYRVKLIDMDGAVSGSVGRPITPEPVTEAVREDEKARRREALSESGETPRIRLMGPAMALASDEGFAEQMREMMLEQVESMVFPNEIPVIADMVVDREDRIWIARTGSGGDGDGPTDLLTADGDYVGTLAADGLRIPDAYGPDGLMAYIESDEMDVQTVRVIRLVALER